MALYDLFLRSIEDGKEMGLLEMVSSVGSLLFFLARLKVQSSENSTAVGLGDAHIYLEVWLFG